MSFPSVMFCWLPWIVGCTSTHLANINHESHQAIRNILSYVEGSPLCSNLQWAAISSHTMKQTRQIIFTAFTFWLPMLYGLWCRSAESRLLTASEWWQSISRNTDKLRSGLTSYVYSLYWTNWQNKMESFPAACHLLNNCNESTSIMYLSTLGLVQSRLMTDRTHRWPSHTGGRKTEDTTN